MLEDSYNKTGHMHNITCELSPMQLPPQSPAKPRFAPTARLRTIWATIVTSRTADPVRQTFNRALVPVLLIFALLSLAAIPFQRTPIDRAIGVLYVISLGAAFWLNRRGSAMGSVLMSVTTLVAILAQLPIALGGAQTQANGTPAELFIPIALATLFVGPRAAPPIYLLTLVGVGVVSSAAGAAATLTAARLLIAGTTLGAFTALIAFGSYHLADALRRSAEVNAQLERRVTERTAELERTNAQIFQIAERRAQEVSEVVHDARNQLGQIRAASDMLLFDAEDAGIDVAQLDAGRATIERALGAQRELFDAMLEAALLSAGTLAIQRDPLEINTLIELAAASDRPRYDRYGCELTVALASEPVWVLGDQRRIVRVVQNVLLNALHYTIAYRQHGGRVAIAVAIAEQRAVISVTDNGCGIAAPELERLGERFVRIISGGQVPEGFGIGLRSSIRVIGLHGGSFRMVSGGLGCGTGVEIALPLLQPARNPL